MPNGRTVAKRVESSSSESKIEAASAMAWKEGMRILSSVEMMVIGQWDCAGRMAAELEHRDFTRQASLRVGQHFRWTMPHGNADFASGQDAGFLSLEDGVFGRLFSGLAMGYATCSCILKAISSFPLESKSYFISCRAWSCRSPTRCVPSCVFV